MNIMPMYMNRIQILRHLPFLLVYDKKYNDFAKENTLHENFLINKSVFSINPSLLNYNDKY